MSDIPRKLNPWLSFIMGIGGSTAVFMAAARFVVVPIAVGVAQKVKSQIESVYYPQNLNSAHSLASRASRFERLSSNWFNKA